jgi:hypothetical protein
MSEKIIKINRAPVMTLWAAVVAERMGQDHEAALTLGKAVAGLNAQSKGRRLGIYQERAAEETDSSRASTEKQSEKISTTQVLGRAVPMQQTKDGLRAVQDGKVISPASVQRYLQQKFGDDLAAVTEALTALAQSYTPTQLADQAYDLYEKFRPTVPEGEKGWGAKGKLDLEQVRSLRQR